MQERELEYVSRHFEGRIFNQFWSQLNILKINPFKLLHVGEFPSHSTRAMLACSNGRLVAGEQPAPAPLPRAPLPPGAIVVPGGYKLSAKDFCLPRTRNNDLTYDEVGRNVTQPGVRVYNKESAKNGAVAIVDVLKASGRPEVTAKQLLKKLFDSPEHGGCGLEEEDVVKCCFDGVCRTN